MGEKASVVSAEQVRRTRVHRSEQTWRSMIERKRSSGIAVEAFCAREGWSSFGRWRALLADRGSDVRTQIGVAAVPRVVARSAAFLDAGEPHVGADASESVEIRVDIGGGIVLTIRRG